MKKLISVLMCLCVMASAFTACTRQQSEEAEVTITGITLTDEGILVGGDPAPSDPSAAVYVANDIIYYEEGHGEDYGEGTESEEHSAQEADRHTVVHITKPGNYMITGSLSAGQIAVDLGKDAEKDKNRVVNITLNNVDITCTVAPAIICYSAYECGPSESAYATKDVDLSAAGFNINIADGSVNNISGSHVAKILNPETGKKLHKYDAAIESLVSFNINGTDGVLNVTSDNEGIETKMHMSINGGIVEINSCDDALNAGEDGISVITINDGRIVANSTLGDEGDGIDSNGWLVINGGYLSAFSSDKAMESGLDSDNGVYINGGTVFSTGNMYDSVSKDSTQSVAVINLDEWIYDGEYLVLKSSAGDAVTGFVSTADYRVMIYSSPLLTEDDYTLYKAENIEGDSVHGIYANITGVAGEVQMAHALRSDGEGMPGGMNDKGNRPQKPRGERPDMPAGEKPQGGGDMVPVQDIIPEFPELDINGADKPDKPDKEGKFDFLGRELTPVFTFVKGVNLFNSVQRYTGE
ncbi:MAG: carbohydrate-binding domain-containing protein [Oscillospiraceae bacterium]|nr:carbohydrate-binding domain-containing protein [Oscillospiraceae bacterium]